MTPASGPFFDKVVFAQDPDRAREGPFLIRSYLPRTRTEPAKSLSLIRSLLRTRTQEARKWYSTVNEIPTYQGDFSSGRSAEAHPGSSRWQGHHQHEQPAGYSERDAEEEAEKWEEEEAEERSDDHMTVVEEYEEEEAEEYEEAEAEEEGLTKGGLAEEGLTEEGNPNPKDPKNPKEHFEEDSVSGKLQHQSPSRVFPMPKPFPRLVERTTQAS